MIRRARIVPARSLPLLLGAAAALGVASAGSPWLAGSSAALALLLLLGLLLDGLRSGRLSAVTVERVLPRHLAVGQRGEVVLRLRNRSGVPWTVRLADGCPPELDPEVEVLEAALPGEGEVELRYAVTPTRRGIFAFSGAGLRLLRPTGLAEHQLELELPGEARVHPGLRGLKQLRLHARRDLLRDHGGRRTRILGRDGDFERLRDFVAGDDIRHVDWKATARLERPIVRDYQAERAQNILILVDGSRLMAARAGRLAKLDYAVEAALTLAYVGLARGDRVGLGVFDDRLRVWVPPRAGPAHFPRLVDAVFAQQPTQTFPRYREASRRILAVARKRSLVVWMTDLLDAEQGKELLGALRILRRRHLSVVAAIEDPEVHALAEAEPVDAAALYAAVAATEVLEDRDALIRRLRAEGASLVAARPEGVVAAVVDRYLDLKQRGAL